MVHIQFTKEYQRNLFEELNLFQERAHYADFVYDLNFLLSLQYIKEPQ